jgi:hypothetical protein
MNDIVEKVKKQALAELPQIMDQEEREEALIEYINSMTNLELLELIGRSLNDGYS